MAVIIDGTAGIANNATDLSYTGTLTGGTGVVNLGSGQVYKDASGKVGIGTSSPNFKTHISTGSAASITQPTAGSYGLYVQQNSSGSTGGIYIQDGASNSGNSLFIADNNGVARVVVDGDGNLLVGTTSNPSAYKQVLAWDGAVISGLDFRDAQAAAGSAFAAAFRRAGTAVGTISTTLSATSFNTASDYRLKESIAPMTGALAKVALLKPCTYKWKVDGSDGQGFIAHELAEVEAGCVTGEKDAVDADGNPQYQGIDTSFLVATLTAAIQELKAIVDTQAQRIAALEGASEANTGVPA